ncbi:hypothetical protein AMECASPLE_027048 [Ameca splendens]|uniref:Uncharacterized protein n=1 Tax=Ameca splendens TaxID=208324 RepID=A0ABV0XI35_9TELE
MESIHPSIFPSFRLSIRPSSHDFIHPSTFFGLRITDLPVLLTFQFKLRLISSCFLSGSGGSFIKASVFLMSSLFGSLLTDELGERLTVSHNAFQTASQHFLFCTNFLICLCLFLIKLCWNSLFNAHFKVQVNCQSAHLDHPSICNVRDLLMLYNDQA